MITHDTPLVGASSSDSKALLLDTYRVGVTCPNAPRTSATRVLRGVEWRQTDVHDPECQSIAMASKKPSAKTRSLGRPVEQQESRPSPIGVRSDESEGATVTQRGHAKLAALITERWQSSQQPLSIQRIVAEFPDASRYDIVAALRTLDKAGQGTLTHAQGTNKPSFTWKVVAPSKQPAKRTRAASSQLELATPPGTKRGTPPKPKRGAGSAPKMIASDGDHPTSRTDANRAKANRTEAPPTAAGILDHHFHLRGGFVVKLTLPTDLTKAEAERLCKFLQALPFASDDSH